MTTCNASTGSYRESLLSISDIHFTIVCGLIFKNHIRGPSIYLNLFFCRYRAKLLKNYTQECPRLAGNCIHRVAQRVLTSHAPTIFSYSPAHDTSYKFLITTYEQPIRHNPKRKITAITSIIIIIIIIIIHYVQYCSVLGYGQSLFTLLM